MRSILVDTWRSIVAHRMRFGLTALGIAWGALMLTFLSSSMLGFEAHFIAEFEEMGPKIVMMGRGTILKERGGERGARQIDLEAKHIDRLERLAKIEHASPEIPIWSMPVRAGRRSKLLRLAGLDSDGDLIRNIQIERGRYLSPTDIERVARVAVLGPEAARRLFDHADPIGQRIVIDGYRFRVVGITTAKGDQLMNTGDPDDLKVIVPYTTAQRWLTKTDDLEEFSFAPTTKQESWNAIERVRELTALREGYDPRIESAMWSFNIQEPLSLIRTLFLGIRIFMMGAGLVTLLVGAVGVMNIMLVVVGERRQEIGVRKAVGARSFDIFIQFLAEATAVATASGLLGASLGVALVQGMAALIPDGSSFQSPPLLDPATAIVLTLALVAVGIISGLIPAIRASQVPPVEALRAF
jgi:putative ABC transport system permease protein